MTTISGQRFIDEKIVTAKSEEHDYDVLVSPVFKYEGEKYRLVLDGHHSLRAAQQDGVEPNWIEATIQDDETVAYLDDGNVEEFLEANFVEDDFYDVKTGKTVWQ